ncbi:MAG: adenylate cyclase [Actinobacteria bacterium]|nr:MAG: adenylate cyclase [Actinomycetota bacterium]
MPHTPPTLSAEQLAELLGLLKKADSVELKLTVPATNIRQLMRTFDLDPLDAQMRQVVFFDTPDLALYEAGVVVRGRRVQGVGDDSTIKLRPVLPDKLSPALRSSPSFGVEVDAMPGGFVCSGSMVNDMGPTGVREVLLGDKPLKKLYTKEQRSFYETHAPDGLDMSQLSMLGPITVFKLKWKPKDFARRVVAEVWQYPDGSRILELSTKCAPSEMFQVAAESRAFLNSKGVEVGGEQATKTRTALEFFSEELKSEGQSA